MNSARITPFDVPQFRHEWDDLRVRLAHIRWPKEPPGNSSAYDADPQLLREICEYWLDPFDWAEQAQAMSTLRHFRFKSQTGISIHFIHEHAHGPSPLPLVITHGWPGSFLEMMRIIPLLTDPAAHGGDAVDAFDVIVPSLPGFGFSDAPENSGMNVFAVAELWAELATELGYPRFAAQGGDIGAGVCTALGLRHADRVIGIHLNYLPGSYRPHTSEGETLTPAEQEFIESQSRWAEEHGAYAHIQATRPLTLACALNDSPAGLAAWILEKFHAWSDCQGKLLSIFSRDELLANISLYWLTQTIYSSCLMYLANRKAPLCFGAGDFVRPPCAFALFPKEISHPPREWLQRGYNVVRWTALAHGGHFAAMEQPRVLAEDIRGFLRPLRA